MTRNLAFGFSVLAFVSGVYACSRPGSHDAPSSQQLSDNAELSLFFAPSDGLFDDPTLYEASITYGSRTDTVVRRGTLPKMGEWLKLRDLPVGTDAKIRMTLYRTNYEPTLKTHDCEAKDTIALASGTAASQVEIVCTPMGGASDPVAVFVKTAALDAKVVEADTSAVLQAVDWSKDLAFSQVDSEKQKIYVRQEFSHDQYFSS